MRFVVYGVGSVGGTIAVRLHHAGHSVVGIARGANLVAMQSAGLTLHSPGGTFVARFPVVSDPEEIEFRPDDAILLTMKGQDTLAALVRLKAGGVTDQPVFCFQNGVSNEPLALRFFENVYGVTVMMPTELVAPGEVFAFFGPQNGAFDLGRFPSGMDKTTETLCQVLEGANFIAMPRHDVMASKYRKLLTNLNNIVGAAMGDEEARRHWYEGAVAEAEIVLKAAGIIWDEREAEARDRLKLTEVDGRTQSGSSTYQSVARGTGVVETDYLNGEIVLLGRLHGVDTPINSAFCKMSVELAKGSMEPRSATDETVRSFMAR